MLQEIEQLLILQDRDQKIRALRTEIRMAPGERKDWEDKLASGQRQLDAAKLKAMETEVERKKLENEAQSKRDMIAKYQTQKFQTRKNEEFQALTNEITRFEKEVQAIEDRELDLMETAEQMKGAVAEAEKQAAALREQVKRQLAGLEEKAAAIQAQLSELEAERARLAAGIDEDLLDTYNRLFKSKGDNAIVPLEHEVCMGCHMKLTTQTAVKVKARREVVHCEQCGRILYWEG